MSGASPCQLPISVAPVGDAEDENLVRGVVQLLQNPVVADAHAPPVAFSAQFDCTDGLGIGLESDERLVNARPNCSRKAAAVPIRARGEENRVGHQEAGLPVSAKAWRSRMGAPSSARASSASTLSMAS